MPYSTRRSRSSESQGRRFWLWLLCLPQVVLGCTSYVELEFREVTSFMAQAEASTTSEARSPGCSDVGTKKKGRP